jgi:hypothetical protein
MDADSAGKPHRRSRPHKARVQALFRQITQKKGTRGLTWAAGLLLLLLPHEQTRWSNDGRSELLKGDSDRPMASSEWE